MGNCMETFRVKQEEEKKEEISFENEIGNDKFVKNEENDDQNKKKSNGIRVKMVLTKEELQWLMLQLSNREANGGVNKRIEDFLSEIEKGRKKLKLNNQGWKPSLDSISEIPELLEMSR